jgi:muramoyltetrapeptide carboxypeptidase
MVNGCEKIELRHPVPLQPGAHIRVISPSFPMLYHSPLAARRAEDVLAGLGLRVSYGAHAAEITDDGRSAGTPQQRAADLMDAFTDPSVDAVFSAWGGETALELLPLLDAGVLRTARKAFIGNSDNVWLNHYLWQAAGLTTYFGATFIDEIGEPGGPFPETVRSFRDALMSAGDLVCRPADGRTSERRQRNAPDARQRGRNVEGGWRWVRHGRGRGTFLGAEIGMLLAMDDHFGLKLDGCVLFWDLRPHLEDLDGAHRVLAELADRVSLGGLAGMVVGPDVRHTPQAWADVVDDLLSAVLPGATYPVIVNADIGHLDPKWVVPYGREVVLDSSSGVVFPRYDAGNA